MSDFDFEELDRAIAGSLGEGRSDDDSPYGSDASAKPSKSAAPSPSMATPASRRQKISSQADNDDNSRPIRSMQDIVPTVRRKPSSEELSAKKVDETPKPVMKRRPGRAMDFMGPSKPAPSRVTPPAEPSAPKEQTSADDSSSTDQNSTTSVTPKVAPETSRLRPRRSKDKHRSSSQSTLDDDNSDSWNSTLESPFLPDAKVEKRPLGGIGPVPPVFVGGPKPFENEDKPVGAPVIPDIDEALTVPDFDANGSSPNDAAKFFGYAGHESSGEPEFNSSDANLDDTTQQAAAEAESVEFIETESDEPLLLEEPEDFFLEANAGPSNDLDESSVTVGSGSINQQYTEEAREEEPTGAMYDTESYHQALSAPAKKRSALKIVLWVLILAILGTAAGFAAYFYVLPLI